MCHHSTFDCIRIVDIGKNDSDCETTIFGKWQTTNELNTVVYISF